MDLVQSLINIVAEWDDVTVAPHRFGGKEFQLGKVEVGHIHRDGMVDIPFTRKLRAQLLAEGRAEPHHLLPETGWVSYYLRSASDLRGAVWLMRLSYLHKRRPRADEAARAAIAAELENASATIRELVMGKR